MKNETQPDHINLNSEYWDRFVENIKVMLLGVEA